MNGADEIKISSRALLALLAGTLDQKQFLQDHGFVKSDRRPDASPAFQHLLREGKMITDVTVERQKDKDDDWIAFRFGKPDAAISNYRAS
jgi:hypothetical protein